MNQLDDKKTTSLYYIINFNNEAMNNEACVLLLLTNETNIETYKFIFDICRKRSDLKMSE